MFYQANDFVKAHNLMVLLMIISVIVTITFIFGGNVFTVVTTSLTSNFCFEGGFFPLYINFFYILNC